MKSIEERLWAYIDGSCTEKEQADTAELIEHDRLYKSKFNELMGLERDFLAMELEEPPMAFTYNVMETIRTENAKTPLKTAINPYIIKSIAAFFIISILALIIYTISQTNWSTATSGGYVLNLPHPTLKIPDVKTYLSGSALKVVLFFDIVLALFLFDAYLRKAKSTKNA